MRKPRPEDVEIITTDLSLYYPNSIKREVQALIFWMAQYHMVKCCWTKTLLPQASLTPIKTIKLFGRRLDVLNTCTHFSKILIKLDGVCEEYKAKIEYKNKLIRKRTKNKKEKTVSSKEKVKRLRRTGIGFHARRYKRMVTKNMGINPAIYKARMKKIFDYIEYNGLRVKVNKKPLGTSKFRLNTLIN